MMDWLGKLLDLPEDFLNCSDGNGGGVIKGTASEATLVCLLAAKERTVRRVKKEHPELTESEIKGRLVAYSSDQSNSSIEKAGLLGSMKMHLIPADEEGRLSSNALQISIKQDIKDGMFPCYVVATLGTTGTCAFDDLTTIGPVCMENDIWLHVDAAYAGAAFSCPEYRHHKRGLEYAESFVFNPHKFMLVNFDCAVLWVKNSKHLMNAFTVERPYLQYENHGTAPEYMHWQIPLGRRFRALKIWCVMKTYGAEGIRKYIRRQTSLANYFAKIVDDDPLFEVCSCNLALVTFRVRGKDNFTKLLIKKLTSRRNVYVIGYTYKKNTVIRFSMNSTETTEADLQNAWQEIKTVTDEILREDKLAEYIINEKEDLIDININLSDPDLEVNLDTLK